MLLFTLLAAQPSGPSTNKPLSVAEKAIPAKQKSFSPIIQENLNGMLWEINPSDTPITQSWITPVEIKIVSSDNANYPFQLTNSLTGSTVLARQATSVPKMAPQGTVLAKKQ